VDEKLKRKRRSIIIALVLYAVVLIIEHSGILPDSIAENHWIMMVFYLAPYLTAGWQVIRKAGLGIVHGQMFDESFLMTLATFGAFVTGENAEACAVMLFYQIGELFQDYAVGKSRNSIAELMEIEPEYANVEREGGIVEVIDPDDVEIGDILVIKPGEKIPVDGTVVSGSSMVNTTALTGEPVPRSVREGDEIISGCVNGEGLLRIRAEKCYEDSTVMKILEMVEEASSRKSRTEQFITRFARYYTPVVVLGALILAIVPSLITGHPATWLYRACTFLVISCPCALVISVPLAFFGGIGAASRAGVLVKGSNYLELMARLDTVVSDKTGTLTKGEFRTNRIECAESVSGTEVLETAALAESMSTHPIALSVREAFEREITGERRENQDESRKTSGEIGENNGENREIHSERIEDFENVTGQGIIAMTSDRHRILAGSALLMKDHGIDFSPVDDPVSTIIYVARDGQYLGAILISDTIRPEAADAIYRMRHAGVRRFIMLTGDRKEAGEEIGRQLAADEVHSELLPGDKVSLVEGFLAELAEPKTKRRRFSRRVDRGKLAFIGDGINDAPVLTRADLGIAMGSMGSDAAIEAADIVIMDDDLRKIPEVIGTARKTIRIAKQNIVFALSVKILILIFGALGIAGMWAAVFADVGVAVICILNSMRMLRGISSTGRAGTADTDKVRRSADSLCCLNHR